MTASWYDNCTTLDPSSWTARTGNWRPGVQVYDAAHAGTDGAGHLAVTANRAAAGFVSARIDTRGKREFTPPCRVQASIRMPEGAQGVVPAFWCLGDNPANPGNWPECGEIDIVEWQSNHPIQARLGNRYASITVHGPTAGAPNTDTPLTPEGRPLGKSDLTDGFHHYDLVWKPDRMLFNLDGCCVWDLHQADYEAAGGDWTPFTGAWPFYLIANVAVNTPMTPKVTDATPFPVSMLIDWVRVDPI